MSFATIYLIMTIVAFAAMMGTLFVVSTYVNLSEAARTRAARRSGAVSAPDHG